MTCKSFQKSEPAFLVVAVRTVLEILDSSVHYETVEVDYLLFADILEVPDKVRNVVTVLLGGLSSEGLLSDFLQGHDVLGTKLGGDTGEQVLQGLALVVAGHDEDVSGDGCLQFRVLEMNDLAVLHEHIDFLDLGDWVAAELLHGGLELLVIRTTDLLGRSLGSSDSSLSSDSASIAELCH